VAEIHKVKCDSCGDEAGWWTFGWAQVVIYESVKDPPEFGSIGHRRHLCPECLQKYLGYGDGGASRGTRP
jgi:hypothetical protein